MASVQYIKGDSEGARASLDRSLALDQAFHQTYLLRGDLLAEMGDKAGALEAYRGALELRPGDLSVLGAVGVYSAQTGDADGALRAFTQITEIEGNALTNEQAELAALDADAARNGGYDRLGQAARNRRDTLRASIANHRAQLHMAYRNKALVLQDMERYTDALAAARTSLDLATDTQKAAVQQLIDDLQKQITG
jgi:tetratricopeptide (TPR) repeat protein